MGKWPFWADDSGSGSQEAGDSGNEFSVRKEVGLLVLVRGKGLRKGLRSKAAVNGRCRQGGLKEGEEARNC